LEPFFRGLRLYTKFNDYCGEIILMPNKLLKALVGFLCMTVTFLQGSASCLGSSEYGPGIHFKDFSYSFPPVFEGTELTHTFVVSNRGTAPLNIKKVTHA